MFIQRGKELNIMIKAILLDVDNTLIDFNKSAEWSIRKCFEEYGLEFTEDVLPTFHRINDELWYRIEQGTITKPELHKIRWQTIFDALGIKENGEEFEKRFVEYVPQAGIPVEGAKELLEYLSAKYIICFASNSSKEQQYIKLTKADMLKYAKHLFISDEIGFAKPAREFFDACMEKLKSVSKEQVIIIGDSLTADIAGGVNYGIKTVWFNFKKGNVPQNLKADYIVNNLSEVKLIL